MKKPLTAKETTINLTNFWGNIGQNMNRFRCKGDEEPCVLCGKPIKEARFFFHDNGAQEAVLPSAATKQDELVPVGPECVRKHKALKPFVVEKKS